MPELPEVEIVRQSLDKKVKQKRVRRVIVRNRNLRFKIPLNFTSFLENQIITKVRRFSKYLIFDLSNNSYCLLHLGMSGTVHVVYKNENSPITNTSFYSSPILPKKHNHIEIIFKDLRIIYNDPRRFGFFQIIKDDISLKKRFSHLGVEPFDSKFNGKYIYSFFKNKEKNIKNFLLDQSFVSELAIFMQVKFCFLAKLILIKKQVN